MNYLLIVDDSRVDRELAGRLLQQSGHYYVDFAADGSEALEQMDERLPLAVVTDMCMPEMDGMQLIRAMRQRFAHVPVIVMTARGSEDIALEALLSGAADYVPKSRLAVDLPQAVERVLAIRLADRPHQMLAGCLRRHELEYELENDVLLVAPLVGQLQHIALELELVDETDCLRLSKALVEALRNAIFHGNLELPFDQITVAQQSSEQVSAALAERRRQTPFRDRRVYFHAELARDAARITVRDQGPGFDTASLPDFTTDASHLVSDAGRGLALIHLFMDEVVLNPRGNQITMVRRARR